MLVEIEQDTAEQVVRAGRDLIEVCPRIPQEERPDGMGRAVADLRVMLDELEEAAAG